MQDNNQHKLCIQDLKTCLRARIILARYGLVNETINQVILQARTANIERIGLRKYVFDILGNIAHLPVKECRFLDEYGRLQSGRTQARNDNMPLVDYLEQYFTAETLPVIVLASHHQAGLREFVL